MLATVSEVLGMSVDAGGVIPGTGAAGWLVCLRVALPVVEGNGSAPGNLYPRLLGLPVVWVNSWHWGAGRGTLWDPPVG